MEEAIRYTLSFLLREDPFYTEKVGYTADKTLWPRYALVIVPSTFFSSDYGRPDSLPPAQPALLDGLPVPYGSTRMERYTHPRGETLIVHADFVAAAYFFISRYEEWMRPTVRDVHGRFPGAECWAAQAGYLDRPLVDEYGFWLKKHVDEHLAATPPTSADRPPQPSASTDTRWQTGFKRIYLTHDIDAPFLYRSLKGRVRSLRDGRGLRRTFADWFNGKSTDPYDTFATINALDNILKSTLNKDKQNPIVQDIYFIKSLGKSVYDKPVYRLGGPALQALKRRLQRQGAVIGLHVSYTAGQRPERIAKEKRHLEKSWGIQTPYSRHHYLRFLSPGQADRLAENGLTDDFSMGFADRAGFRLATSRPVRAIDPATRRLTDLTYHPLLCMDSSLFDPRYMNSDEAEARQTLHTLLDRAYAAGGEVCLLWHNTSFMQAQPTDHDKPACHNGHSLQSNHTAQANRPDQPAMPGTNPDRIAYDTPRRLYAEACIYITRLHKVEYKPQLRILLLCDAFPPAFAPRMGYLVRYLQAQGHCFTVVTERIPDAGAFAFLRSPETEVWAYDFPNLFSKYLGPHRRTRQLYRAAARCCANRPYDLLLCSTYRTLPLPQTARIARRYGLPWVADLRDLIEQYPDCGFLSHRVPAWGGLGPILARLWGVHQIQKRNRQLRQADAITTVSPWHTNLLNYAITPRQPVVYIPNGYDPALYTFEPQSAKTFDIVYTGRLISTDLRDPSPLLQALAEGRRNRTAWAMDTRLVFYTDPVSQRQIADLAARLTPELHIGRPELPDADAPIQMRAYIASNDIPTVLNRAAILLVLTNRQSRQSDTLSETHLYRPWRWFFQKTADRQPQGILTTKLFEALASEKPILCVRSDEGLIAGLLHESGQGCAATTPDEVSRFLSQCHAQWRQQGYTHRPGKADVRDRYRRDLQARQFERLFFHILGIPFAQDMFLGHDTDAGYPPA